LLSAGLIELDSECYVFTRLGHLLVDLIESDLNHNEKWILLFLIILNYNFEGQRNSVIFTADNIISNLVSAGLNEEEVITQIREFITKKNIDMASVFKEDVFWYVTFARDNKFIKIYSAANAPDKKDLFDHMILEHKKDKTKDCIAHKYQSGGSYTKSTLFDEVSVLYYVYYLRKKNYANYEEFISGLLTEYGELTVNMKVDKITGFIKNHEDILKTEIIKTNLTKECV
jgi:hypothetical protein